MTTRAREGGPKEHCMGPAKIAAWKSISYINAPALSTFSYLHYRSASTVISLLPKANFTTSIQPNLCLLCSRPALSSPSTPFSIHSFHMPKPSQYSLICSTRNFLFIPALRGSSSLVTLPIHDTPTKHIKRFISRRFTFLLSALHVNIFFIDDIAKIHSSPGIATSTTIYADDVQHHLLMFSGHLLILSCLKYMQIQA